MALDAPTLTLLVAVAIIVVCCVAFPKVRRTLLGMWDALNAIDTLFYLLCGLVIVAAVSWAIVYVLWRLLSGLL
jgi:predicted ferric reductase